jgi:hypothetical protein
VIVIRDATFLDLIHISKPFKVPTCLLQTMQCIQAMLMQIVGTGLANLENGKKSKKNTPDRSGSGNTKAGKKAGGGKNKEGAAAHKHSDSDSDSNEGDLLLNGTAGAASAVTVVSSGDTAGTVGEGNGEVLRSTALARLTVPYSIGMIIGIALAGVLISAFGGGAKGAPDAQGRNYLSESILHKL